MFEFGDTRLLLFRRQHAQVLNSDVYLYAKARGLLEKTPVVLRVLHAAAFLAKVSRRDIDNELAIRPTPNGVRAF